VGRGTWDVGRGSVGFDSWKMELKGGEYLSESWVEEQSHATVRNIPFFISFEDEWMREG